jgi:hypothetical protein
MPRATRPEVTLADVQAWPPAACRRPGPGAVLPGRPAMLADTSVTACAGRSGSQSQWPAGGRRDHTAIVAARPVPGMQRIRAMVMGVLSWNMRPAASGLSPSVAALPGRPGSRDAGSADLYSQTPRWTDGFARTDQHDLRAGTLVGQWSPSPTGDLALGGISWPAGSGRGWRHARLPVMRRAPTGWAARSPGSWRRGRA